MDDTGTFFVISEDYTRGIWSSKAFQNAEAVAKRHVLETGENCHVIFSNLQDDRPEVWTFWLELGRMRSIRES